MHSKDGIKEMDGQACLRNNISVEINIEQTFRMPCFHSPFQRKHDQRRQKKDLARRKRLATVLLTVLP